MLGELKALGGIAENIVLRHGSSGDGLFPRDPAKPILIRLPNNLLFPVEDIEFVDDRILIKKDALIAPAERNFFERYQRSFSWGWTGQRQSAELIAMFDMLPSEAHTILITDFGMRDLLEGNPVERAQRRFLKGSMLRWNNKHVLVPLVELANHGEDGFPCSLDEADNLQIEGDAGDEI